MKEKDIFLEEKQEVEELLKTKLLSPDIAKFSATPGGFITLTLSGEEQGMVNIIRAFPFTAENEFLSVRTADDKQKELGMIEKLSVFDRFTTFVGGLFDLTAVVYYLSIVVFCLFLCVQSLEKKRWN